MAVIHGKKAIIKKNSTDVGEMTSWTIDVAGDMAETTAFGDDWKTYSFGTAGWTGTMEGYLDLSDASQKALHDALIASSPDPELTDVEFYPDSGSTAKYSGSIIVSGTSVNAVHTDIVKITFNFQGNGELTYTAST